MSSRTPTATSSPGPARRPRGRPREFDREEILERAMRLFWERGYDSTSVSDLTEAMGITAPTLYSTFGDKKGLFLEALNRYEAGQGQFVIRALSEEPTAERAIERLLLDTVDFFFVPDNPKGCMMVLSATNCTVESLDIRDELAERRRAGERVLRARIAAGRDAGEMPPNTDVDALTGMVVATLFGLSLKARDGASRVALKKIVAQLMQAWPRRKSASRK
jgi:TetR/AcrR family transcriptional regulator, copper-responsive repressor